MPIYEYYCQDCCRKVSLLWRSFADAQSREAICPRCGGRQLDRRVSRVAVVRSESSRMENISDMDGLDGLDENDPRSLARFMRKMADETGEDLGSEFDEVIGRLEAGEDPESIEKSMPDLGGGDDDFGVM